MLIPDDNTPAGPAPGLVATRSLGSGFDAERFGYGGACDTDAAVAVGLVLMAMVAMVAPHSHGLTVEHLQAMLEADDDTLREVDVVLNYQLEQQMAQSTGENTDSYDPFEMDPAKVYVVSL